MARTGRPPAPIERKRRRGTLRADRTPGASTTSTLAAVEPIGAVPEAMADATEDAIDAASWLTGADQVMVALLRETVAEREVLRDAVTAGHGKRSDLRDLDRQTLDLLTLLGMTPTARARLGLAEVHAESTLEAIKARRDREV